MKKILLFIFAGVIGLALASCVQNEESASVAALRQAKADQLTSIATLNNANAEAALILAKAEAALKAAEAKYQESMAAYQQALKENQELLNENQELQNDHQRIVNDQLALQLQRAQATLEAEIEAALLQAQADIERAKADYERAKAELQAALDGASAAKRNKIQTLIYQADVVFADLNNKKDLLVQAQTQVVLLENDLIGFEKAKAKQIEDNQFQIAVNKLNIAQLGEASESSFAFYEEQLAHARASIIKLQADLDPIEANWEIAGADAGVARGYLDEFNSDYEYITRGYYSNFVDYSTDPITLHPFNIGFDGYFGLFDIDFTAALKNSIKLVEKTYRAKLYDDLYSYDYYVWYYTINDEREYAEYNVYGADNDVFDAMVDSYNEQIEGYKQDTTDIRSSREYVMAAEALAEAEALCAKQLDPTKPEGAWLKTLQDSLAHLNERWNAEGGHIQERSDSIYRIESEIEYYIYSCEAAVVPYQDAIEPFENYINYVVGGLIPQAELEIECVEYVRDWYCNPEQIELRNEVIAYYEEMLVNVEEYFGLRMDIRVQLYFYNDLVYKLESILGGSIDVAQAILDLEKENIRLQKEIDDYTDINNTEGAIDLLNAQIEKYQEDIVILQTQYDELRAEIEALLAEE